MLGSLDLLNVVSFLSKIFSVVLDVPLLERSGVNKNDSVFDESSSSGKFVIGGVIDGIYDSSLSGGGLSLPSEISIVEGECSVFEVSSSSSDN